MAINVDVSKLDELILLISNSVDEKQKRILLGKATEVYGRGGAAHVKELTGVAFSTLHSGNVEANSEEGIVSDGRTRRKGHRFNKAACCCLDSSESGWFGFMLPSVIVLINLISS